MRLLKLLEGLYQELKKYNEIEAQKEERRQEKILLLGTHNYPKVPFPIYVGLFIRNQLALKNLRVKDIAQKAKCTMSLVSQVLNGDLRSEKIEGILAESLGYESFGQLIAAAPKLPVEEAAFPNRPAYFKASRNPTSPEYSWIRHQLANHNIKQREIAIKANCHRRYVSDVVCGHYTSANIRAAVAESLGYASWESLWADAVANAGKTENLQDAGCGEGAVAG
jgi:transcriptional regulator with XRE-family HTH domain